MTEIEIKYLQDKARQAYKGGKIPSFMMTGGAATAVTGALLYAFGTGVAVTVGKAALFFLAPLSIFTGFTVGMIQAIKLEKEVARMNQEKRDYFSQAYSNCISRGDRVPQGMADRLATETVKDIVERWQGKDKQTSF